MLTIASRLAASAAIVLAGPATAVTVAATTDIFLASQPNGTTVSGYFGSDAAPAAAPVAFTVTGPVLTFAATGSSSVDASCFAGPDGGCYNDESSFSPAPASGAYQGPASALVGVFAGATAVDAASGIATIDYSQAANRSLAAYAPAIGQIFFIGDGLTDGGAVQQFTAPVGATRLFLALADSIGASGGNLGSASVDVTGATLTAAAVPEPASWVLLVAGFGTVGVVARRRRPAVVTA